MLSTRGTDGGRHECDAAGRDTDDHDMPGSNVKQRYTQRYIVHVAIFVVVTGKNPS
jgi:hypothetical protein